MKKVLGLDLGTTSIGWALVNEAENTNEKSSIVKLGVRVNPLSVDEISNFEKGKSITTNAERTLKRGMRRNLQRYKLRRESLIETLKSNGFISDATTLSENGNHTTFETYNLRAKAATEMISLEQLARVLLMINKKRGYKSSRKVKEVDEGSLIDGMEVAKKLYNENLTPGQFCLQLLQAGKKYLPDFYRSDLQSEFDKVFDKQLSFYPNFLSVELKNELQGKKRDAVWAICAKEFKEKGFELVGTKRQGNASQQKFENYEWRAKALSEKLDLEQLVIVLQQINIQLNNSSGYLGAISDRSKELYFNQQTVGQYLMEKLDADPHYSLRNKVFYRQDYLDEFEKIWQTQSIYHKELTPDLKSEIRDIIIFYQRRLKSQKGLISFCEFESREIELVVNGKTIRKTTGLRVSPKSSPVFQEFKIWQNLNNTKVTDKKNSASRFLDQDEMNTLARELFIKKELSSSEALKILFKNHKDLELNFKKIEGNRTISEFFKAYQSIIELSGHGKHEFSKMSADEIISLVQDIFSALGYNTNILLFDALTEGHDIQQQALFKLWHLLYSYEGDNSKTGTESLIEKISAITGFPKEYAAIVASISLQDDYGSLSTKAMRKILPHLKEGFAYGGRKERQEEPSACEFAGYRHSASSLTKEEIKNKTYKNRLENLPKNSLRNPVVEKILNQLVNVVNGVIDAYGKPDEIRIELARELKKSADEREEMTTAINKTTTENEQIRKLLKSEFGLDHVSRNDLIRYKLYRELETRGCKTLYSNTYIPKEKLFTNDFDIEHIIPQSRLFDDSFSNKTLERRDINIEKGNETAYDYISNKYGAEMLSEYTQIVDDLLKAGKISLTKCRKLKMKGKDIPDDFIERDLRDSQYIARAAKGMLEKIANDVVTTTGSITDRLREDWQLVDVMQELNWEKYDKLGLTEIIEGREGQRIKRIKDWTKRNDHRHHAMDALTIAFTKRSHIQYLNNLNARSDKSGSIYGIETNELFRDDRGKLRFKPPMPIGQFRALAKKHLDNTLVSIKAKNKVVTKNINITKKKNGTNKKIQLTPRGQLHNETIYGSNKVYTTKEVKIGASFDETLIAKVSKKIYREALLKRLHEFGNDPKKAFTGRNSMSNNPVYVDAARTIVVPEKVKIVDIETIYTIRKDVGPDLRIDKVVDKKVRQKLEERLREYDNNPKQAFSNLDEYPIWLNHQKGIALKRVTITGIANAQALRDKKDKDGNLILDENGKTIPADFVNTGNNHHVAVYRDKEGNLQENVVSFFEATTRASLRLPIIDKDYRKDEGWEFLFSMKQNEYFVFPNEKTGFKPNEIDLLNPENYALISPNLFRVQKIATKDYFFRHHLETTVENNNNLKGITWLRCGLNSIEGIVKIRINHIGLIIAIGEE
ncbi:MAG TPA: type II CRISPR RNA-guided endonuclease Cas9 [Marinilabiliaceae bacterium]|nr:type II CRISPR RNA-guided endonuclease Cas9 [Marinilabiliaceae bacterium]